MTKWNSAVVFAYGEVGYVCLETLLSMGCEVLAVFTHEDDPNETIWFRSVEELARKQGIPCYTDSPSNHMEELARLRFDLVFSFHYRSMIAMDIIGLAPGGAYNVHGGLLPRFRGRAPVNWAIIMGEKQSGVTLHHMTERADCGDIVDQEEVAIGFGDTAMDLYMSIVDASRLIVKRNYRPIALGTASRRPQDESRAGRFARRTPADGVIRWASSSIEIYNLVRGTTHPFPGAFSNFDGDVEGKVFVWRARPLPKAVTGGREPGTVLSLLPLCVATGEGVLKLERLQMEGHPEQNDIKFVQTFDVSVGDMFR